MYYADEPKNEKTRLPMSKEICVIGLLSGIYLPVTLLTPILMVLTGYNILIPLLAVLDVTLFAVAMINPVTPKRKRACRIAAVIGAVMILLIVLYYLFAYLGFYPLMSFTNTDTGYVGNLS